MTKSGNSQAQVQTQSQTQVQTLSPQQVLEVRLLQLSAIELEERVKAELLENPALEENQNSVETDPFGEMSESDSTNSELDSLSTSNESLTGTDSLSGDFLTDDDVPDYYVNSSLNRSPDEQVADIPFSESVSFYDLLKEQLGEQDLTNRQRKIAEYLIGSLDNDGMLDKSIQVIADELAIYNGIDISLTEIENILRIVQDFEPAGIGARNLQECLLLQIERKEDSEIKILTKTIITECFEEFIRKRWDKIIQKLQIENSVFKQALEELLRLNPRPGSALGESIGENTQHIIPDFQVDTFEGQIQFSLNNFNVPELRVSKNFLEMLDSQINSKNNTQREAALFIRQKLNSAKGFIDAVRQREQTLTRTMRVIIEMQRPFFLEGDETLLRPMILKDVAERAGFDISTISRVSSNKYVQTNFGIYPLKFFFTDGITSTTGQEVSIKEVHSIIRELIENEKNEEPLTDEQLSGLIKERGYAVARRTVAKYREQLGIPVARLRKNNIH